MDGYKGDKLDNWTNKRHIVNLNMARFDKVAVLEKIGSTGMVPVFYHKDAEIAKKVIKACYEGGVRAFEFTNRGDFAHLRTAPKAVQASCQFSSETNKRRSFFSAPSLAQISASFPA